MWEDGGGDSASYPIRFPLHPAKAGVNETTFEAKALWVGKLLVWRLLEC